MDKIDFQIHRKRYPEACQWELTWRCNLHCVHCYTDCFNRPDKIREELETSEVLRILDEMAEAGCVMLTLTGGEPLLRPDFFEIYRHAKKRGFVVTVFSNATLITPAVAALFGELPPRCVEISFHGITEETYESVTQGKGSWLRLQEGIELLREHEVPFLLKTNALTMNQHEILEIKRLAEDWGVRFKLGEELIKTLEGSSDPARYGLTDAQLTAIQDQDETIAKEACQKNCAAPTPCEKGDRSFHIDACGRLQLCGGNREGSYDLRQGNFQEGFYQAMPTFPCPYKLSVVTGALPSS